MLVLSPLILCGLLFGLGSRSTLFLDRPELGAAASVWTTVLRRVMVMRVLGRPT